MHLQFQPKKSSIQKVLGNNQKHRGVGQTPIQKEEDESGERCKCCKAQRDVIPECVLRLSAYRMGKKRDEATKPRPVIVKFVIEKTRQGQVLQKVQ